MYRWPLTGHFGDALQTRDGEGHHDAQAGAGHQQAVSNKQAGHRQPLVPCRQDRQCLRQGSLEIGQTREHMCSCQGQPPRGSVSERQPGPELPSTGRE